MKILIVDDSAVVRRAVRTLFESDAVFEVCGEAENGREAIEKTADLRPELVVMDLFMPVLIGLDRGIRRVKPGVPVIPFSGFSSVLEENEARCAGISALVSKSDPSILPNIARKLQIGDSCAADLSWF